MKGRTRTRDAIAHMSGIDEPCNMFDCIVEMCGFIEAVKSHESMSREDLAEACLQRCHFMLRKAVCAPYTTSLSLSGWQIKQANLKEGA